MKYIDFAEQYWQDQKQFLRESSLNSYLWNYDTYIKPFFVDYEMEDINSRVAQQFLNHLCITKNKKGTLLSKHYIGDIMIIFKMIMYEAMRQGIIPEFTFKTRYPNNVHDQKQEFKMVKEDDYKPLIDYCLDNLNQNTVGIMLALLAGLRIGEICGLKWGKVNFEENTIYIDNIVNRITNARGGGSKIKDGLPKTESGKRYIPMTDMLRDFLLKWYNKNHIIKEDNETGKPLAVPPPENNYVVRNENPNEPRTLRNNAMKILKSLGIDYIHFHNLRHTFCSVGLQKGVDIKVMSEFMGHSQTDITLNIYTHTTEFQKREALKKLNM